MLFMRVMTRYGLAVPLFLRSPDRTKSEEIRNVNQEFFGRPCDI